MEWSFREREDGQVDAVVEGVPTVFNDAIADAVSSMPPRGESGTGPSTYWIDVAREGALRAAAAGDEKPFTWGNAYSMRFAAPDQIVASFDYDESGDTIATISLSDFLQLLDAWRQRVVEARAKATDPLPETYRRNGM